MDNVIHQKIMKRVVSKSGRTVFRKKRIGDLVAVRVGDQVSIGYSLCHKNDLYNMVEGRHKPGFGRAAATGRAVKWATRDTIEYPPSLKRYVKKFMKRCELYYKGAAMPVVVPMAVEYPEHFRSTRR